MHDALPYAGAPATGVLFDPELVRKYDRPGPRYTSYPTIDQFVEAYDARTHAATLRKRHTTRGPGANTRPLSLYVHIPFCEALCYFCDCNKVVTGDHGNGARYLDCLEGEFRLVAGLLAGGRCAGHVHLGGGTPTFLSAAELADLMRRLGQQFDLQPGEYAIEIDPRSVDDDKIAALGRLGFNRMSLGVQDFSPAVQQAVNRIQTGEETAQAIAAARRHGFVSINVDMIYGLPRQSPTGFNDSLDQLLAMKPDRIALYGYAHLPGQCAPQRHIHAADLPSADVTLEIMGLAIGRLAAAGYVYIGMNHFALPHDELAIAARHAGLQRSFHGYSTQPDSDLLGFGVSAISKIGATYSQNVQTLDQYQARVDRGELPVLRGIRLTADGLLRRAVIQSLLCYFEVSIESIEIAYLIKFREYFAGEWDKLVQLERDGVITLDTEWITVTPRGKLLVRAVAMVFDRYLSRGDPLPHQSTAP